MSNTEPFQPTEHDVEIIIEARKLTMAIFPSLIRYYSLLINENEKADPEIIIDAKHLVDLTSAIIKRDKVLHPERFETVSKPKPSQRGNFGGMFAYYGESIPFLKNVPESTESKL